MLDATGGNNQTSAWGFNAAYEHYWNKSSQDVALRRAYQSISYNSTANGVLCASQATAGTFGVAFTVASCNRQLQDVEHRFPHAVEHLDSQTAMGVDIVYQKVAVGLVRRHRDLSVRVRRRQLSARSGDQGSWMGQFRIHRNFYS